MTVKQMPSYFCDRTATVSDSKHRTGFAGKSPVFIQNEKSNIRESV